MNGQIPIDNNMPEDLKAAINYLNANNVSLTDAYNDEEINLIPDDDSNFGNVDLSDTEIDDSDDVAGEDADLSDVAFGEESVDVDDLNSMF